VSTVEFLVLAAAAVIVIARFELLCLRELAGTSEVELRFLTRAGWTALIIVAIPLGGIAYLYLGRTR
jgi:hypothetical protein